MRLPALLRPRREGRRRAEFRELFAFAWHQAWSCLFPAIILGSLFLTRGLDDGPIARYDLMLLICLGAQWLLWRTGFETLDEVKVIGIFHLLGLALEIWKVQHGSWAYPGPGWTKVFAVPLYGGFMYASVASYMCQAWRRLDLHLAPWPKDHWRSLVALAIYLNFFTNAYLPDLRWAVFVLLPVIFHRTRVAYVANGPTRRMPLLVAFILIAVFVWLAENLGTFVDAWRYPHQTGRWEAVRLQKLSSWTLLIIVSLLLVAELKRLKDRVAAPP